MRQEVLDKLHATILEIMDEVDRVCRENDIQYYLADGSLIGAVRHHGFIPWDDDLDIMIARRDYDRFCAIFEFVSNKNFYIQSSEANPLFWKSHAKVCKKNTVYQEKGGMEEGIFVDVFPIDSASSKNCFSQRMRFSLIKLCDRIVSYRLFRGYNPGKALLFCKLSRPFSLGTIRVFQRRLMSYSSKRHDCFYIYDDVGVYGYKRSLWPKILFPASIHCDFAGRKYSIPEKFHDILTITFGDYMQLPPMNERKSHNPERLSFDITGSDEIID